MKNNYKLILGMFTAIIFSMGVVSAATIVHPGDMQGWGFANETGTTGIGEMVNGPGTPPLGTGSARLATPDAADGMILGIAAYQGTRLDEITALQYNTYRSAGGAAQAIALQFNIDANVSDGDESWQGRLVFEPYYTETVNTGEWQTWDVMTQGKWWATGAPINSECSIGSPCTWQEVLDAFPDAGIHNTLGAVMFKAGSGWAGFDGNVDAFTIGVNGVNNTYDFELEAPVVCQETGVGGLTAHYINEAPTEPLEVTCDIGVFFNEDGVINGAEIHGTIDSAKSVQYGIYVNGANVDVTNSAITVEEGYPHQFVSLTYREGATGTVSDNSLTGAHRAAMVIRGTGTDVTIKDNEIIGSGPKSSGWAENGIQIDQGATATVMNNLIEDHWWNLDNWVSTGLLIMSDSVTSHRNTIRNNDVGVYLIGDENNFIHNVIEITYDEVDVDNIYGAFIFGDNNGVRQSTITSGTGTGLGLGVMGTNNKLIRNTVSGWEENVWDGGDETKWPKPFQQ